MKFYDTSSLLLKTETLFEDQEEFAISSITLEELEHIKTAINKDPDVKYSARKLVRKLDEHMGEYKVVIYNETFENPILEAGISSTNDSKILSCALHLMDEGFPIEFITNDICLKHIAKIFIPKVSSISEENDCYEGYKEVQMTDQEMADFYMSLTLNTYNLLPNEYLIVKNLEGEIVDKFCWTGTRHRSLSYYDFISKWFGNVKPIKDDIYQAFFADSLMNNKITMVKGPAGSGKTYLSLAFLLNQLERGQIDKIIIFCNTIATKDSAKLGLIY